MISLPWEEVPTTDEATTSYHVQGGTLTEFGLFGCDPLRDRADLIHRREQYFFTRHPNFDDIFSNIVSADGSLFHSAVSDFIRVTKSLQKLL